MGGVSWLQSFIITLAVGASIGLALGRLLRWVEKQNRTAEIVVSCVWAALALGSMISVARWLT